MALSTYGTNHALAVRFWAKKLAAEALRKTFFSDLIGRSTDSVIVRRDEMKEAGDRVTVGLRAQLTGAGVSGDATLEGNEEALATYGDTLMIDQLRNGVRSAGRMSEQRVLFDFREEAKAGLSDWIADRWDTSYFNQICGFTPQSDVRYTGNNAVIAPDTTHIFRPNSKTADESLTTGDEFTLSIIDLLVARAAQFTTAAGSGVPIRPATFNGQKKWIMGFIGGRIRIWCVVDRPKGRRCRSGPDQNKVALRWRCLMLGTCRSAPLPAITRATFSVGCSPQRFSSRASPMCARRAGSWRSRPVGCRFRAKQFSSQGYAKSWVLSACSCRACGGSRGSCSLPMPSVSTRRTVNTRSTISLSAVRRWAGGTTAPASPFSR